MTCPLLTIPPILVTITGSTTTPTVGQSYTLTCTLSGGGDTLQTQGSTYHWRKNGAIINGQLEQTLSFSSLRLSDAGQYSCTVTMSAIVYSATKDVSLQGW